MKVCVKCRREMRCEQNGVACHFGHGHVYVGDCFKCPSCGMEAIVTNAAPIHLRPDSLDKFHVIQMFPEVEQEVQV